MGRDFAGVYNLLENKFMFIKQVLVQPLPTLKCVMVMIIQIFVKKSVSWLGLHLKNHSSGANGK
jgi:hypothetical protein